MSKKNASALTKQVRALQNAFSALDIDNDLGELIVAMRRPGWTTPAEALLVSAILESMLAQVEALGTLSQQLVAGSLAVGSE